MTAVMELLPVCSGTVMLSVLLVRQTSLPLAEWEKACKKNGICPRDPSMVEWLLGFRLLSAPPWRPAFDRLYLSEDDRTLIATESGTNLPTDRRLRHCGVGIYGGGNSSGQFTSPLRAQIQVNDHAELVAVVLAAEAIELQVGAFPHGVELILDNQAVCFACQTLACSGKLRTSTAHYPTYRPFSRDIRKSGRPVLFGFRWISSNTKEGDGHDEEVVFANDVISMIVPTLLPPDARRLIVRRRRLWGVLAFGFSLLKPCRSCW